jgi:hypothetical protein
LKILYVHSHSFYTFNECCSSWFRWPLNRPDRSVLINGQWYGRKFSSNWLLNLPESDTSRYLSPQAGNLDKFGAFTDYLGL